MKIRRVEEDVGILMILATCRKSCDQHYARLIPRGGWIHDYNTVDSAWCVPKEFAVRGEWDSVREAREWLVARGAKEIGAD